MSVFTIAKKTIIKLTLVAYMFMHAVVPPGFMVSASSEGGAFKLCHGDQKSTQLLTFLNHKNTQINAHHDAPLEQDIEKNLKQDEHEEHNIQLCISGIASVFSLDNLSAATYFFIPLNEYTQSLKTTFIITTYQKNHLVRAPPQFS